MKAHFVTFFSPGTFLAEEDKRPIDSWDVEKAKSMAATIKQRYGATPYGFQFTTRTRRAKDLDSKVTKTSGMYYLHAKVETLEEIEARNDPRESRLVSNMRGNKWDRVVTNTKGYKWTQPLQKGDVVLPCPQDLSTCSGPCCA